MHRAYLVEKETVRVIILRSGSIEAEVLVSAEFRRVKVNNTNKVLQTRQDVEEETIKYTYKIYFIILQKKK